MDIQSLVSALICFCGITVMGFVIIYFYLRQNFPHGNIMKKKEKTNEFCEKHGIYMTQQYWREFDSKSGELGAFKAVGPTYCKICGLDGVV